MESRVQRFSLQSVARAILPESRTAKCLRIRAHDCDVQVWKSKEHGTASYGGLQTCGSVWACPVCSAKIAERRRVELLDAMELHKAQGGAVYLLTTTPISAATFWPSCWTSKERPCNPSSVTARSRRFSRRWAILGRFGRWK